MVQGTLEYRLRRLTGHFRLPVAFIALYLLSFLFLFLTVCIYRVFLS